MRRLSIVTSQCPPGIELSIVFGIWSIRIAGSGRSTRNMQAPPALSASSERAITMPTPAPCAPVLKHLRPFTTQ